MESERIHITIVRHGESEGNVLHLFQGQDDFPLSENGQKQAEALGRHLQETGFVCDAVISSPLARARQTAEHIAGRLGLTVEIDLDFIEQDFGEWNRVSYRDPAFLSSRPDYYSPYEKAGIYGESKFELFGRAVGAVQRLALKKPGRYLVVTHGALINMLLYAMLGIFPKPTLEGPRFPHGNTGVTTLSYDPKNHRWRLLGLNKQDHLNGAR